MSKLLLFAIAGLAAQLVDGALGMAFGVTATTLLLFTGLAPAHASAAVHFAELGTTFFSGVSHWKLRNVHWPTVLFLGGPGAVGAFAGATVLAHLSTKAAQPVVYMLLTGLGLYVFVRFALFPVATRPPADGDARGSDKGPGVRTSQMGLAALGLFGGFLDATGGGGWGPTTTSTLMSVGRRHPRTIIGTVNTAEFFVTLAASAGFVLGLEDVAVGSWMPVVGLLIGGIIAAPIAAWAVSHFRPRVLGVAVGCLLVGINSWRLAALYGWPIVGAAIALGFLALFALVRHRAAGVRTGEFAAENNVPVDVM
ncbi:sulfite exporter TauE/SafE family protein [Corynebacterium heidelbergense]|uniref:Probable membrane transporter protein n=1 Tax=Corynebacterium heidelbergense TaxID=2055947 RepID=A0A364V6R6_9CORY|nr:sulfite exporter TauE/SafE family protein [Corynebacterium heidelbergense]RAV32311.1 hypothetical protein DLJ54_03970 [Corynebacterium heidelbergense]